MADTPRTLAALQTLLADNTSGEISPQDVRDWLVSTYVLTGPEISVTGATTATVGQMHACADAGSPANYTLTLPAASGCSGRLLGVRISPSMTKLVTLDGNSSETIDGALTRVIWAGESAVLYCDGSNWFKVGGKTRPMFCQSAPGTNSTVATATDVKLSINTVVSDNTGLMADTTAGRIYARRDGTYQVAPVVRYNNLSGAGRVTAWAYKNGSTGTYYAQSEQAGASATYPFVWISLPVVLAAGDYMELWAAQFTGSSQTQYADGTQQGSSLLLEEVPQW